MNPREEHLLGQFIPLHYHGQMLADAARTGSFREAIDGLTPRGGHVVELGAGTGVMSWFAAKHARKVTCIERLPNTVDAARRLLRANGAPNVELIQADAREWMATEPVDMLICEMLHCGLLREKQAQVIEGFKERHRERFGIDIPRIIPEATLLAAQPVFQPYEFSGFHAPVPLFMNAGAASTTVELAPPIVYATIVYARPYSTRLGIDQVLTIDRDGTLNALRIVTKNLVGIFPEQQRSADWHMHYLSLPLQQPLTVRAGDRVRISFAYDAGAEIETLVSALRVAVASRRM